MEKDRKKKIITLLVIVFVTTLSIAFAAVSRNLNINGTAKMDTANWDVHFDNLSKANLINTAEEVNEPNYADNKGTIENINVKLKNPKDEVIYTVDIVNDGTMDAEVTVTSITNFTEEESKLLDFGVYYSDGTKITKYDLLEAGNKKEVTIKLRYKDDITEFDLPEVPLTISFGFTINYIQSDASIVVTPSGDLENVVSTLAKGANTSSTSTFFNGSITKESVESITFLSTLKVPKEVQSTAWDASLNKDGSVIAWYTDLDENNLYELKIGGNGKVYAPSDSNRLFRDFTKLREINFNNNFDTSNATSMTAMFYNCISLKSLDLSSFDTSKVANMGSMFEDCEKLESINLSSFDTSNVTNMNWLFDECYSLTSLNIENFNTSNVTNMGGTFSKCNSLTNLDLNSFDTSKVTNMQYMFQKCNSLKSLDLNLFDTSKVTDMSHMFDGCNSLKSLDLSSFNTQNVTDMSYMFQGCNSLKSLDLSLFNTLNVTSMFRMFYNCTSLLFLDLENLYFSNVNNYGGMFYNCNSLEKINLSGITSDKYSNDNFKGIINIIPKSITLYVLNEDCVTLGQAINSNVNFVVKEA